MTQQQEHFLRTRKTHIIIRECSHFSCDSCATVQRSKGVMKKTGDLVDDILFYKNSLITMAKEWEKRSNNIFLENIDIDGEVEDKPIANSLKELINSMDTRM